MVMDSITGFIGQSTAYRKIVADISKAQKLKSTSVLILGETGTGKELIARSIHFGSNRGKAPFIPLNCATIPSELAESTIFGHVQGAFTGATSKRKGYFELANMGTLFLDEIGDMPNHLQVKILRVLEDRRIIRVGGHHEKGLDVRIIAATNANLQDKMNSLHFRKDLYFRLARFTIYVPPLRERKDDIPVLVNHFVKQIAVELEKPPPSVHSKTMALLLSYPFTGNVRELRNTIEHALIECDGDTILPEHLTFNSQCEPDNRVSIDPSTREIARRSFGIHAPSIPRTTLPPDQLELILIKGALAHEKGDIEAAAELLNLSTKKIKRVADSNKSNEISNNESSDEAIIVGYVKTKGSINNSECRQLLGVQIHRASYLLKKLARQGILIKARGGRWTRYELADSITNSVLIDNRFVN